MNLLCSRCVMARVRARISISLFVLMFLSGCVYSTTPEWGTGNGQVSVDIDRNLMTAEIQSEMGDGYDETVVIENCENQSITIRGLLISSQVYSDHADLATIESAMGASVIIHEMAWSEATSIEEGTAGRVSIKDWSMPLNPVESVGSKIDDNKDEWKIIGIIPGSKNIADGLNVLEHWHQAIELIGYIADEGGTIGENCKLEEQRNAMIITKIKTEQGEVTLSGDSPDEYQLGDTDIFGGWTFILFFLIFGIGGGVGLFIVSTMIIRQGAKATAEALLGREGFAKAVQMKIDIKSSKKAGLESVEDRAKRQKKAAPPVKKSKVEDVAIPGFDLDNILSSANPSESPQQIVQGGSVTVTSQVKDMEQQVQPSNVTQISSNPKPATSVTSNQPETMQRKGHFSASMSSSRSSAQNIRSQSPEESARPVRRRAVKRAAKPAEPEPKQEKRSSVTDDEEFSDFSF